MNDPFLKTLNQSVNQFELSFGVTFVVAGGVITGTMISAKSFIDSFSETFSSAWPGGQSESVRDGFAAWGEPGAEGIHDEFVHLKDARYVFGREFTPSVADGALWRGKLESVSGFSLGALVQS